MKQYMNFQNNYTILNPLSKNSKKKKTHNECMKLYLQLHSNIGIMHISIL